MIRADICRRLGISCSPFIVGQAGNDNPWERRALIEACDFGFMWLEAEAGNRHWADVPTLIRQNKRVFYATSGHLDEVGASLLWTERVNTLERCESFDEAIFVAAALFAHDKPGTVGANFPNGPTRLSRLLKLCESPIEARLAVHLFESIDECSLCDLNAQVSVQNYRVDFTITDLGRVAVDGKEPCVKIIVECDGHDFHERTKEQAARDKKRDRDLQSAGWQVLRFTGSEIWRDPSGCVGQLLSFLKQKEALLV